MSEKERLFLRPRAHRRIVLKGGYVMPWGSITSPDGPPRIESEERIVASQTIGLYLQLLIRNETSLERFIRNHFTKERDISFCDLPTEHIPEEESK